MFANLRYISILIFILLTGIVLSLSFYVKGNMVDSLVQSAANEKINSIKSMYSQNIWNKYHNVMFFISSRPRNEWDAYPQYSSFLEDSADFFKEFKVLKAAVISIDGGAIFFDSNPSLNLKPMNGDIYSAEISPLESRYIIQNSSSIDGGSNAEGLAAKYNANILVVLDLNDSVKILSRIQFALLGLFEIMLMIAVGIIFIIAKKVEELFDKQQELSIEMASAKSSAEAESKAKTQFLANISHELRTPLNAIIGFSEIMKTEAMGPIGTPQYKEFIEDIHISGMHLLSLINDILDFSKAEDNKLQVDFEPVELLKLIKICLRMVLPRAEEAKLELVANLPSEPLFALADPKRLKQVILNLLSNSVKFTPEKGKITINIQKKIDEDFVIIEISDTGVGMAAQDLAKALSPFGQVDNKLSRRYEGTGLGLPLTKKLVELMKGTFDIKSELGLGSTVSIVLQQGHPSEHKA